MSTEKKDDYKNLIDLLAVYSEVTTRLAELEVETNKAFLDLVDDTKADYATLQEALTATETALKDLALLHPEWFAGDSKTVKTPFGQVHSHKTTSHEAPDPVSAIARIKAAQARAIKAGNEVLATQLGALIRVEEKLNFDALGEVDVDDLARFGIVRKTEESVTIKAQKVSLGQAVKAAAKRAKKDEVAA